MIHDDFSAGSEHQVKGIAEDDVGTGISNLLRVQTLYAAVGAYRHKCWSSYCTARKLHSTGTGFTIGCFDFELMWQLGMVFRVT